MEPTRRLSGLLEGVRNGPRAASPAVAGRFRPGPPPIPTEIELLAPCLVRRLHASPHRISICIPVSTSPIRFRRVLSLVPGLCACLLSACVSYPMRTAGAYRDFQRGQLERALSLYEDPEVTGSTFLAGAEAGTVALTLGDWEKAKEHFLRAVVASEDALGRGALESSNLIETLSSFGLNDRTQTYGGEGFERVYLHACLAMAFLATGDLDGVWVEVQRANQILEGEEELYEKDYEAGGFGHLMSAVAYEIFGEPDQAYIDYVRMEEKGVGAELAGRALVRLSKRLGREDDLARWEARYGADEPRPADAASIVVLAGVGLAPVKAQGSLAIPTRQGLIPVAVPAYQQQGQPVAGLQLIEEGFGAGVRTSVVEHVSAVAEENLSDRLGLIAAKSVGRGILKRELTKHLEDEHGVGGRLVGDLFAVLTEQADLRAWQTLPDTWQAARLFVSPGEHALRLEALGGTSLQLGAYRLEPGETMLVLARSIGRNLYAHPIGGEPVGTSSSTVEPSASGEATVSTTPWLGDS